MTTNKHPLIGTRKQIEDALDLPSCLKKVEEGLIAYSDQRATVPPVGFLGFEKPPGDVHIKYGHLHDSFYYVVKIASGFYHNPSLGLPSSNGLMLVFNKLTGELEAVLLDEGLLTDKRTALAGALCAKYLAPPVVNAIGVIGTGTQAVYQLEALKMVHPCRLVRVWGRNADRARLLMTHPLLSDYSMELASSVEEIAQTCQLIITTTPSTSPLLFGNQICPGTHITAIGADSKAKQELDETVFLKADLLVADSLEQCLKEGDLAHVSHFQSVEGKVVELGAGLKNKSLLAREPHWITVADLTGVAVQDIQIAEAVLASLHRQAASHDGSITSLGR